MLRKNVHIYKITRAPQFSSLAIASITNFVYDQSSLRFPVPIDRGEGRDVPENTNQDQK